MAKPRNPRKNSTENPTVPPVETASATNPVEATTSQPSPSTRKPTIVRSEPRANIVPINLEEEIRRLAYLLSERRGFEPGHEAEDWLTAEHEVLQRYHQHSA